MLREFHRGMLLGLRVESLTIDGKAVSEPALDRLNFWIESWGAWNAARQDYFVAWDRLHRVLTASAELPRRRSGGRGSP